MVSKRVLLCLFATILVANCVEFEDEARVAARGTGGAYGGGGASGETVEPQPGGTSPTGSGRGLHFGLNSWNSGLFEFDDVPGLLWPFTNVRTRPDDRTSGPPSHGVDQSGREPLDVDFISTNPGTGEMHFNVGSGHHQPPAHPSQGVPTLGGSPGQIPNGYHPFFPGFGSPFGGINNMFPFHFGGADFKPWYEGDNVCVDREEKITDWDTTDKFGGGSGGFYDVNININHCNDAPNKRVCTFISNVNDKKRTVTVTKQCCHGYSRTEVSGGYCEKVDMFTVEDTAEKMGAKEFLRAAKNNGLAEKLSGNITLFVPLDNAFTAFSEQMFETNLVVLPLGRNRRAAAAAMPKDISGITVKDLALNHMVKGYVNIEDIENEQILNSEFATIRMNIFPKSYMDRDYEYRFKYTANCVPLVKINQQATNGVVHVVERVLVPVTQTLMEMVRARSDLAVLRTVLEKTDLAKQLEMKNQTYTLFAPTDAAFMKLEPGVRRIVKEGNMCALNMLKNHILDLTFCSATVVKGSKTNTYNIVGDKLTFERLQKGAAMPEATTAAAAEAESGNAENVEGDETKDLVEQNEIDTDDSDYILLNGESRVIESDLMATNGVMHIIDTVLPTETAIPMTDLLGKRNLTIFQRLIEASNFTSQINELYNMSFFVPIDRAFEANKWKAELEANPEALMNNEELHQFLNYHIGVSYTKTSDLKEEIIPTRSGEELRINLYATHPIFSNVMNRATVNCARLVHFDHESCGSILHELDKVLEPPKKTLLQTLEQPKFSKFVNLVERANLRSLLENASVDHTVLVPSDDVFDEQREWYDRLMENPHEVENVVKTHILPDVLCCSGIVQSEWPFIRSVETINGKNLKIDRQRRPLIGNAGIIKCDTVATNGVIHEINDVIIVKENRHNPLFF